MDERDERKRTSDDASKRTSTTSKPGSPACSGISVEDTYLLTARCPVFRRRDSHLGFRTELETLVGHAKGKGTSGGPARLKVPMGQSGADRPIVVMKRGNACRAKGVGHSRCLLGQRETGGTQLSHRKAPAFVEWHERESHVRICERLGVKVPGPTRRREMIGQASSHRALARLYPRHGFGLLRPILAYLLCRRRSPCMVVSPMSEHRHDRAFAISSSLRSRRRRAGGGAAPRAG